jgi:uracil phosphoribosyltransferase
MVHNLAEKNSIFNQFIAEIRDVEIQKDSMRFRRNLERIGEVMAYEISKKLDYIESDVITPLGTANVNLIKEQPVIGSILRAGLPMHQGVLNIFDRAENSFISAYRRHHKNGEFEIEVEYMASPSIEGKTLILVDPMLATGSSMVLVYKSLLQLGTPKKVYIVSAISSKDAVEFVKSKLPKNTELWLGAIDEELTAQSYIVPGLGDAGDLAFGSKS